MNVRIAFLAAIAALISNNGAAAACGSYEDACEVESGTYFIVSPESAGPHPAVLFLHGYAAGGYVALSIGEPMLARGYAVIGPQGLDDQNGLASWNLPPPKNSDGRDESAFLQQVIKDAAARHDIDPARIILTGHSFGGELTSYIACEHPELARAYAPLAGTFRRPLPQFNDCAGPVNLLHTHGWTDEDVPIEGRSVWDGEFVQGDVFDAMQIWREINGCGGLPPDTTEIGDAYLRRSWRNCGAGSLELALHPGGHEIPPNWVDMVLNWYERLPQRGDQ